MKRRNDQFPYPLRNNYQRKRSYFYSWFFHSTVSDLVNSNSQDLNQSQEVFTRWGDIAHSLIDRLLRS